MAELTQEKDDVEEFERKVLMGDPTELRNAFYLFDGDVDGKLSEDEVVGPMSVRLIAQGPIEWVSG